MNELSPHKLGTFRLVNALQEHAYFAETREKLPSELLAEFDRAQRDLLPALNILTHVIDRAEQPEDGYLALWRLLSCTVTLVDPDANKLGIASALKSAASAEAGRMSAIKARGEAWRRWRKPAIRIAVEEWAKNPKLPMTEIASRIERRFPSGGQLPGNKEILKLLTRWRPKVNPSRK